MLQTVSEATIEVNETVHGASKEEYRRMKDWLERKIENSKREPIAEVVRLTPCLAHLLLYRNKNNRPVSTRNSANLASDIANGRWEFNGQSVVISSTGILIDGQHRCQQVIATNKAVTTVMVFGPKEASRFTIDTGRAKTIGHFLGMKGHKYTHALGPALNYLLQWKENGYINFGGKNPNLPTTAQKLEALDEHKSIETSIEFTAESMKTVRSHAAVAFCHYVFAKKSGRGAADEFIGRVIDGDGVRKGDPAYYCRERLKNLSRGVSANVRIDLIFKCWNASRLGHRIDHCKLSSTTLPKVER